MSESHVQKYSRFRSRGAFFGRAKSGPSKVEQDYNEQRLIYKCILDPTVNNSGYAGVTRVVRDGGSARMEGDTLVIENASSVMLLTRIEYFPDFSEDKVEALREAVEQISPDYTKLLDRARKVQSEMLNRVTVDFGGATQYAMSSEELLSDQRSSPGYSAAYLEKFFEMCRYWFILTSGKYPTMQAETNANINLQISPGVQGDLREGMEAYFNWMESLVPDFRTNAKKYLRDARHTLCPHTEPTERSRYPFRPCRFHRRDMAASLLDFCRRLVCAPVLGSLSGNRRPGFPAQSA